MADAQLGAEIARLLSLDEQRLYELIGRELTGRQALPMTPAELAERGRKWFRAHRDQIQRSVCDSRTLRELTERSDELQLVAAIADLIAAICVDVAPTTVAVLLLKHGLNRLCDEVW